MRKIIVGMGYLHVALILTGIIFLGKKFFLIFLFSAAGFVIGLATFIGTVENLIGGEFIFRDVVVQRFPCTDIAPAKIGRQNHAFGRFFHDGDID